MKPRASISKEPHAQTRETVRSYFVPLLLLSTLVFAFSIWANLSWEIQDPSWFVFFPPFESGVDRNMNHHLGAEYLNIAQAIVKGRGFSDPFQAETGPTAWMPPILCCIEAFFLWIFAGDLDLVMNAMIVLQNISLITTFWIIFTLLGQVSRPWIAAVLGLQLVMQFRYAFQMTHDCGFLMLIMTGLIAGLCLGNPFGSTKRATLWGLFGGVASLSSPVIGFLWLLLSGIKGFGRWYYLFLSVAIMTLVLTPWTVRNYLVFGKFIPVKSNLAYELYQTQCLQSRGILETSVFATHPWANNNQPRRDYVLLGETEFLRQKKDLFLEALHNNPLNYLKRVFERFLGVTLVYQPDNVFLEQRRPIELLASYLIYPIPFLAWCFMGIKLVRTGLSRTETVIFWAYPIYFLPYIAISYYSRYEFPAHPIKWILFIWFGDFIYSHLLTEMESLETRTEDTIGVSHE